MKGKEKMHLVKQWERGHGRPSEVPQGCPRPGFLQLFYNILVHVVYTCVCCISMFRCLCRPLQLGCALARLTS